jgi:hypothetical protein
MIGTGTAIFIAVVGFLAIRNQLDTIWTAVGSIIIGFFVILWLVVFGLPPSRSVWAVFRERMRTLASLIARIETLERKHDALTATWGREAQNTLDLISLLELSTSVNTVFLMSDRLSAEQVSEKLRSLTNYASVIVRNISSHPDRTGLEEALKSILGILIIVAGIKHVPFETTASTLANGLGLRYAERIVDVSSIIDAYGLDYASKWRNLVRSPTN